MHDVEPGGPARPDAGRPALPEPVEVQSAILTMVQASQGIEANALEDATFEKFGLDPEDPDADRLVGDALEELVDELGVLTWITGDRTVHVTDLVTGAVFTHVLSRRELELGALHGGLDLGALQRFEGLHLPGDGPVVVWADGSGDAHWIGPDDWLDAFPVGSVLAVRIDPEGAFEIRVLDAEPAVDPTIVERMRAAYDRHENEPRLPVNGEDLALELLLEEPGTFAEPMATLTALAAAAGLVVHGFEAGHDETVWHNRRRMQRAFTVYTAFGGDERITDRVLEVIDAADPAPGEPAPTDDELRQALVALRDEEVLGFITLELFERGDADTATNADAFVASLRRSASRSIDVGTAELVAALHAEARHEVLVAEQHLELAHQADPDNLLAIDRLAAYASERGDAARAVRLWQQLPPSDAILDDLRSLEPFATPTHRRLGRNEPCWCGSGRKYKQCHLGATELPALPDRVGWLARKAVAYLERRRGDAAEDVIHVAAARADSEDDERAIVEAMQDPIVLDLVLTEGGWFEQFLEDRSPLLPEDEALLAASWLLVERTVYEVTGVRRGKGVDVRDLRTGEQLEVRERTFSRTASPHGLVCARAVPDGETHQFVGGLFPVAPGREGDLLEVLEYGEPEEIAAWVAGLHRPPVLTTREGEPLVECELVVELGDPVAARVFLDETYEHSASAPADGWVELFSINDDEDIVRAHLHLDGSRLSVSTTSEPRVERVLEAIRTALPGAEVVRDERAPLDPAAAAAKAPVPPLPSLPVDPEMEELLAGFRDDYEQRWCDESIPALAGLTPREAAADPTRRDELVRLIASFDVPAPPGAVVMRPDRLRELLGLA